MTLTMKRIERDPSAPAGQPSTIIVGVGEDETGREIKFAGDHRMMVPLAEMLEAGEEFEVEVESWQVLG
jgi:hypothetical protein